MDPLSAGSVAAIVLQVIDFGSRLVSKTVEISRSPSGLLIGNSDLEKITEDLKQVSERLQESLQTESSSRYLTVDELAERKLGEECQAVASELLSVLQRLNLAGKQNKWRSFRQVFLSVLKENRIAELEKRLDRFRQELVLRLLASLR